MSGTVRTIIVKKKNLACRFETVCWSFIIWLVQACITGRSVLETPAYISILENSFSYMLFCKFYLHAFPNHHLVQPHAKQLHIFLHLNQFIVDCQRGSKIMPLRSDYYEPRPAEQGEAGWRAFHFSAHSDLYQVTTLHCVDLLCCNGNNGIRAL